MSRDQGPRDRRPRDKFPQPTNAGRWLDFFESAGDRLFWSGLLCLLVSLGAAAVAHLIYLLWSQT